MEDIISKAKNYAMLKHMGQTRDDGSPYIFHPLRVAEYIALSKHGHDKNLIAAGALHDVIEDCGVTYEEVKKEFNEDIANLVFEVTKVKPDKKTASYFPNLKTHRGKILKFFDRADNVADKGGWTDEKMDWYLETSKFWRDSADDPIYHLSKPKFREKVVELWKKWKPTYSTSFYTKPIKGQITVDQAIQRKEFLDKDKNCKLCGMPEEMIQEGHWEEGKHAKR